MNLLDLFLIDLSIIFTINLLLWLYVAFFPIRVVVVKRIHLGATGLAIPGFIFVTSSGNCERVIRHEYQHHLQMKRFSPLGVALMLGWHYGGGYLIHILKHRSLPRFMSLWNTNPLEKDAIQASNSDTELKRLRNWSPKRE